MTAERIANEGAQWGLSRERAAVIVDDLLNNAPAAIAAAHEETDGVPDELISTVEHQLDRLGSGA